MPFVGGFKHALVSDGTGLNVDNSTPADVRYGSEADSCAAKSDVRFAPNSDRKSGFPQNVMSALPPKADIGAAQINVRFGPKVDSCIASLAPIRSRL
jgi:hypothetical protein